MILNLDRIVYAPEGAATSPPPPPPPASPPPPPPAAAAATQAAGGAADAVAAAAGKTAIEAGGDGAARATPADWPTDWRDKMAIGADGKVDAKKLDQLKRYDSPLAWSNAGFEARSKIDGGRRDEPMPDEAKDPDGAKKWREERGIPLDPTKYEIPKPLQDKLTADDKPVLENYTTFAHKHGMTPTEVARNIEWYTGLVEGQAAEQTAADDKSKDDTEEVLRKEWGTEYKPNATVALRFAQETVPSMDLFKARLPDGRLLGNVPEFFKAFAQLGIAKYGDVSFAGGEAAKVTESRMVELKKIMDTDIDKWNASSDLRKEYAGLLAAAQKRQGATDSTGGGGPSR